MGARDEIARPVVVRVCGGRVGGCVREALLMLVVGRAVVALLLWVSLLLMPMVVVGAALMMRVGVKRMGPAGSDTKVFVV